MNEKSTTSKIKSAARSLILHCSPHRPCPIMEAAAYKRLYPHEYFEKFIVEETRPDGRPLGRARPVSVARGVVSTADGSCLVKIGRTTCLCAVKLEVVETELSTPNEGVMKVTVELPPMCSSDTRPGRQNEEAAYVTGRVNDVLRDGNVIDLKQLSIEDNKRCWKIWIDVYVLDHDGCILDCALIAANGALRDTTLPTVSIDEKGEVIVIGKTGDDDADERKAKKSKNQNLVSQRTPLSVTCAMYKQVLLVDPTHEEEDLVETSVTVCTDEHEKIVGVYKLGGIVEASEGEIAKCIAAARLRYKNIRTALDEAFQYK